MSAPITFPVDEEKFFEKCKRHQNIPKNDAMKQILLKRIMQPFDIGQTCSEQEVNEAIKRHFKEYTTLRRELLNFGYMWRDPHTGIWTVKKKELTEEDYRSITILERHARDVGILED